MLHSTITPLVAVPLIFILECCSCRINQNFSFIPAGCSDAASILTAIIAFLSSAAVIITCYGIYTGDISFLDHIDIACLIIGRNFVICTKYGLFKANHLKILRGIVMSGRMKQLQLVLPANFASYPEIRATIKLEAENAQVNSNTEILVFRRSEEMFGVRNYDNSTRKRLLDDTFTEMYKFYDPANAD